MKKLYLRLFGGLGNQQFQYAYGYSLSKQAGKELVIDDSYFLPVFQSTMHINGFFYPCKLKLLIGEQEFHNSRLTRYVFGILFYKKLITKAARRLLGVLNFELADGCDQVPRRHDAHWICRGYFQKSSLIEKHRHAIGGAMRLDVDEIRHAEFHDYLRIIDSCDEPTSVHVRRGDYVDKSKHYHSHYAELGEGYYQRAFEQIRRRVSRVDAIMIFSDDINWVAKNLKFEGRCYYVDLGAHSDTDILEQQLMMRCRNHVIANSSFSWMGAWCAQNRGVVCAPTKWFADPERPEVQYCPDEWIRVPNEL